MRARSRLLTSIRSALLTLPFIWAGPLAAEPVVNADVAPGEIASPASAIAAAVSAPATATPTPPVKPVVAARPAVTLVVKADLTRQTLTVIDHGTTVATWPISSGVEDHATPRGTFQPEWTAKMWYSRTYDNAAMPNAVFFKDGAAIHATQSTGALGHAASHGCVRLAPANAETFYKLVQRHGLTHIRISVFGTPRATTTAARDRDRGGERTPRIERRQVAGGNIFDGTGTASDLARSYGAMSYGRMPLSAIRYR